MLRRVYIIAGTIFLASVLLLLRYNYDSEIKDTNIIQFPVHDPTHSADIGDPDREEPEEHIEVKLMCDEMNTEQFKVEMRERNQHTQIWCKGHPNALKSPREIWHYEKVGESGINWCPVFKAASSSTSAFFCPLYYDKCQDLGAQIWRNNNHFGAIPKAKNLIVVRHPFERLLSAYRDKIQSPNPNDPFLVPVMRDIVSKFRKVDVSNKKDILDKAIIEAADYLRAQPGFNRGHLSFVKDSDNPYLNPISATFEEFVRGVIDDFVPGSNHWRPAINYCAPCGMNYEYIIKSEEYTCEFDHFLRAIGHKSEDRVDKRVNFNPVREPKDRTDVYNFYASLSDELLDSLYKHYRSDCEIFQYDCKDLIERVKLQKQGVA